MKTFRASFRRVSELFSFSWPKVYKPIIRDRIVNAVFFIYLSGFSGYSLKNGKASINAFLDDYAFTIEAFISLYQVTFDEKWLNDAKLLTEYAIEHFYDDKNGMFFYTSDVDAPLIARKMEVACSRREARGVV